jgi:YVTN family beta-propeller protein
MPLCLLVWLCTLAALPHATAAEGDARVPQQSAPSGHLSHESQASSPASPAKPTSPNRVIREGLSVELSATPVGYHGELVEGGYAEVRFRVTDAVTGRPIRSLAPGAWMDLGQTVADKEGQNRDCRQRMSLYLSGRVGIRPMIDLNSYFVLALNRDASISVVDPHVGMAGRTYLYAHIPLPRPGADWAQTADDTRLFVTIPRGGHVAVVDTQDFKVTGGVDVGGLPVRIVLQEDGRYLWVGDDSPKSGGVVAVDPGTLTVAARIPTGLGHHEIAVAPDGRHVFVTNRSDGSVSVIEVARLAKVKDVKTGPQPISLAYSTLSQSVYVADGATGEIAVLDGRRHDLVHRIAAKPGLGPMRFTADGRWGFVVNSTEHAVHVVDASTNRLAHTIPVGGRPFHVGFTAAFAYVRSLDSAQVSMIPLGELGRGQAPAAAGFPAGDTAPGSVGPGFAVAGPTVPALGEAAVVVANPADGNVYYYMEGMVAPMATFRNYGHRPAAVTVVNRSLREREPGVYATTVQLPASGRYEVGFLLDSPQVLTCFSAEVKPSPTAVRSGPPLTVAYLLKERRVPVGEPVRVAFKLTDAQTTAPRTGLADVRLLSYMAPGRHRIEAPVREVGHGVYEAMLTMPEAGAFYVHVTVPSAQIGAGDLPFLSVVAESGTRPAASRRTP